MRIDPYKHKERYEGWGERVDKSGIPEISKYNSDLVLHYLEDMELGGIKLRYSVGNYIFNNLFNNFIDAEIQGESENFWNINKTLGTNIIGGAFLGGNYWAKPDGTGFSETCEDNDKDGFCDGEYVLEENNIDYLPLSKFRLKVIETFFCLFFNSHVERFDISGIGFGFFIIAMFSRSSFLWFISMWGKR